jgi:sugar/nucleoside kinase (ribokinase family)
MKGNWELGILSPDFSFWVHLRLTGCLPITYSHAVHADRFVNPGSLSPQRAIQLLPVVVAGHICLDIIPELPQCPEGTLCCPGHPLLVGPAAISTGGPVSNTGLALHKLGIPTRLAAKVGGDALGAIIRTLLQQYGPGLDSGLSTDPSAGTSYSVIISPPGVDRTFWHYPGANDTFSADDIPYDLAAQAGLFHFGYPPVMRGMYADGGAGLCEVFRRAKETGVTTSLDMCVPDPNAESGKCDWRAIYRAALPLVDIFLPSADELLFTLHRPDYERFFARPDPLAAISPELLTDMAAEVLGMGVKIVVIKIGDRGLFLQTAASGQLAGMGRAAPADPACWSGKRMWAPCFRVEVVGTTGSGDATIAGFLAALLRGFDPAAAITAGVAVGACSVEAADALSGIRSWEETCSRVAAAWPRRPITIESPDWRRDDQLGIWIGPDAR